jgi:hypothetical protein
VISASVEVDRAPAVVFDFYAVHHLDNHPRWDPKMELRQVTDGPIGVGTRFHRRHTRIGSPVEGSMEVVEFEPDTSFGVVITDATPGGVLEVRSRATFEGIAGGCTRLTLHVDVPGSEATMDPSMIEASLARIRDLVEAET